MPNIHFSSNPIQGALDVKDEIMRKSEKSEEKLKVLREDMRISRVQKVSTIAINKNSLDLSTSDSKSPLTSHYGDTLTSHYGDI